MAVPLHPLAAIAQAHGADWLTQNLPPSAGQVVTTMPTQFPRLSWNGFLSLYDAFAQVYGAFFLGHPPDMPGRANASFIGTSKMLGEGADGVAGLWLRVDANNNIIERIVIKNVKMNQREYDDLDRYYVIDTLQGVPGVAPLAGHRRIPTEVYCQEISSNFLHLPSLNVIKMLAWGDDPIDLTWRIYSEYAPFGNINQLIGQYQQRWKKNASGRAQYEPAMSPIPEPFLWAVFEGLAKATIQMRNPPRGITHLPRGAFGGWQGDQVVHQDIKPSNVFLGSKATGRFQCYPQVQIGDFGGARLTSPNEPVPVNPWTFLYGLHTEGFEPPELFHVPSPPQPQNAAFVQPPGIIVPPPNGLPISRALAHTNIWQIGMVMRCLISLQTERQVVPIQYHNVNHFSLVPGGIGPAKDNWIPALNPTPLSNYSAVLLDLVRSCLQSRVDRRPTPAALLTSIQLQGAPHLDGMDTHPQNIVHNRPNNIYRVDKGDEYRIGMSARYFPHGRPKRRRR